MSQHDGVINNATGAAVLTDLNNAFGAIRSSNSGPLEPIVTLPGLTWYDTSGPTPLLKIRNADDTAWITLRYSGAERLNFRATKAAVQLLAPANTFVAISFPSVVYDFGGYYNPTTSLYTPPAGNYIFGVTLYLDGASGPPIDSNMQTMLTKNGANARYRIDYEVLTNGYLNPSLVAYIVCNGADQIGVMANQTSLPGGASLLQMAETCMFYGYKI